MSIEGFYPGERRLSQIRKFAGNRRVWYDSDAICGDSLTPVLAEVNKDFSVNIRREQITGFDSISRNLQTLRPDLNYSFEEFRNLEWQYWVNPDVLSRSQPVPGVSFLMFMFNCAGYEQNIVTSRAPELLDCTMALLPRYPFINSLYIRRDGQRTIPGEVFKAQIVDEGLLFEDFLPNVKKVLAYSRNAKIVWHSWPNDRGVFKDHRVVEVEMIDTIQNLWPVWEKIVAQ